jgi:hypothetical protein
MKKNYLFIAFILCSSIITKAQWVPQALQIMHNSADASVQNVKVWLNDTVWVSNLAFQQSSARTSFAAGTHTVGISAISATSQVQSVLQQTFQVGPVDSVTSIDDQFLIINGIVGNASTPLSINSYTRGIAGMPSPFSGFVYFHNGSTAYNNLNLAFTPTTAVNPVPANISNFVYLQEAYREMGNSFNVPGYTISATSGTTALGGFIFPSSAFLGKIVKVVINSSFNLAQKTTGIGFGMVMVPAAGGSVTPVTKIEAPTAINEVSQNALDVKAFPNPVNNTLYLSLDNAGAAYNVTVNDLTGKKVLELKNLSTVESKIDVSTLNKGIYLLTVKQGETTKTLKFVKE